MKSALRPTALLLALLVVFHGCGSADPAPATPPPRPNIVLFLLDTVRADHLGLYGYPRETMPFVAGLAERGLLFERAYAPSTWTAPSMASLFTGRWVHEHGVLSGLAATRGALKRGQQVELNRIPSGLDTLPELLQRAGYRTFGAADNFNIGEAMGFTRGFAEFSAKDQGGLRHGKVVAEWRERLVSGPPYFLYLHYMAAHAPYRRRSPWYDPQTPPERREIAAYDSNLSFMDEKIREVFEALDLDSDAVVIVTADHGEEFGDHGSIGHGNTLYEELLRVPLVLFGPGRVPVGRVAAPVSLVDLLPTLRELLGLEPDAPDAGRSLLAAARAPDPSRVLFPMRWDEFASPPISRKAVVTERYKLILTQPEGREELYDLHADPAERQDLARQRPALVAQLRSELERLERSTRAASREFTPGVEVSREKAQQLRALGYVR
jgi:arylsulfatase A-like enzyme